MSKHNNNEIPGLWVRGIAGENHTGSYWTDGQNLYSYRLVIGETIQDGKKLLHEWTAMGLGFRSQTTSCHVGKARSYADVIADGRELRGCIQ